MVTAGLGCAQLAVCRRIYQTCRDQQEHWNGRAQRFQAGRWHLMTDVANGSGAWLYGV
jgi:hypothetical protein